MRTKAGKGRASQAAESFLISDEESECNPTSIVYDMEDAQWLSENDEDEWFDVADNGSGNGGVDSDPDNWSLVSGPSSPYPITTGTMCVDCMDLIEKAKNMKTPLKKKRPSGENVESWCKITDLCWPFFFTVCESVRFFVKQLHRM